MLANKNFEQKCYAWAPRGDTEGSNFQNCKKVFNCNRDPLKTKLRQKRIYWDIITCLENIQTKIDVNLSSTTLKVLNLD